MSDSTMLDAALAYAAATWPVFPIEPGGKVPIGALVPHGFKDASTDPAVIRAWWERCPDANVGVRTGVAFDALDVDGGQEGVTAVSEACQQAGGDIGGGPWALIGGGGHHLLYLPTGIGNKAKFIDHCDWRGAGGYIVAPPSLHASGRRYQWATAALLEDIGETVPLTPYGWDAPLQPAPSWLVALLEPPTTEPRHAGPVPTSGAYGQRALENELGRLMLAQVGQRNDQLNKSAMSLGQLIAAGQLDAGLAVDALLDAAQRIGLGETEAEATIKSGLRAGMAKPRRLSA